MGNWTVLCRWGQTVCGAQAAENVGHSTNQPQN